MKKQKKQYFSMIEIVAIIAVVAVLFSAFASTISAVYNANDTFIDESKAVLVLENVIECLKVKENISREEVKKILTKEFQHSDLGKGNRFCAKAVEQDGEFVISVIRIKDDRLLAEVKL